MAHGWSHGPVGATVAAWPAASLVGSYELLLWLIRTAAPGALVRGAGADHTGGASDHPGAALRFLAVSGANGWSVDGNGLGVHGFTAEREDQSADHVFGPDRASEPGTWGMGKAYRASDQVIADHSMLAGAGASQSDEQDIDSAAVAAYRTSVSNGRPLSERKLAALCGKTSRRWARNRMADAREPAGAGFSG